MGCYPSKSKPATDRIDDTAVSPDAELAKGVRIKGRRRKAVKGRITGRRKANRSTNSSGTLSPRFSRLSPTSLSQDSLYFDAEDDLPESPVSSDGGHDLVSAFSASLQRLTKSLSSRTVDERERAAMERQMAAMVPEDAVLQPEPPASCLPIFSEVYSRRFVRLTKPPAGMSMLSAPAQAEIRRQLDATQQEKEPDVSGPPGASHATAAERKLSATSQVGPSGRVPVCETCEDADATTFMVRGLKYSSNKKKEPSSQAFYHLLAADIYAFDIKLNHIAKHVQLPTPPQLGDMSGLPPNERLPPLLIVNIQLPSYPASLWGASDGEGASLVYYFALPEGWHPSQETNRAALGLLQRFVNDGRETDKSPTRDRLKLLARIANVDEWAVKGPLSGYEVTLLRKYNDKPLLTRPQQKFFTGPNYLEVDLDVHQWAYLARKAFSGFINRLGNVIFENALVIQGNREEELPEQVLAAARVKYVDFSKVKAFPAGTMEDALHEGVPAANGTP